MDAASRRNEVRVVGTCVRGERGRGGEKKGRGKGKGDTDYREDVGFCAGYSRIK